MCTRKNQTYFKKELLTIKFEWFTLEFSEFCNNFAGCVIRKLNKIGAFGETSELSGLSVLESIYSYEGSPTARGVGVGFGCHIF